MDDTSREDFLLGGLSNRLADSTARLLLLPEDPDREVVSFDPEFWERLTDLRTIQLGDSGSARFGDREIPTAYAAALVDWYGGAEGWNHYLAVHRNGAVEVGFGSRGGRTGHEPNGDPVRGFFLVSIVTYTWAALELARQLGVVDDGRWLLALGLRQTRGALLAGLGEGWAEPGNYRNSVGGCSDNDLLWHIELDTLPGDSADAEQVAFTLGDRLEDAWGVRQRRYLDHRGDTKGRLDARRVR